MKIYPFHLRMAELYLKGKTETLTKKEIKEMFKCHESNVDMCLRIIHLHELSTIAAEMDDHLWNLEVCRKIQELEMQGI
ncbi:MAG TPA: hypothetical protein VK462_04860 [Nitrososphaeraceae archaeon]|nr:hypothetical protein [Nitrososphaeraceae archaeon]